MRKSLLTVSLLSGAVLISTLTTAQRADRFAYAVTDLSEQNGNWSYLRKLDLQTGEYSTVLLNGNDQSQLAFDATTKKQLSTPFTDARYGNIANAAFGTGVAAAAYDNVNNRLYYSPMFIDQLRYIDLKTMKVYFVTDASFTGKPDKSSDQGNVVTRMVIASDGYGYAMTNDATQLIRFSTGKKLQITDLGSLVDDPANKGVSIHNSCSSFGGDVIADDAGNLYVFSARNNVFKINIESRVATYLGSVTGLPTNFTINGAAVDNNNQVVVGSALETSSLFVVNPKTWAGVPLKMSGAVFHSSDLANGNYLVSGNKPKGIGSDLIPATVVNTGNNKLFIYPNPVVDNQFAIQFRDMTPGNYTIQVSDVMGRQVKQIAVNLANENQIQLVNLSPGNAKGVYLVKVTDQTSKSVNSVKVVVQ